MRISLVLVVLPVVMVCTQATTLRASEADELLQALAQQTEATQAALWKSVIEFCSGDENGATVELDAAIALAQQVLAAAQEPATVALLPKVSKRLRKLFARALADLAEAKTILEDSLKQARQKLQMLQKSCKMIAKIKKKILRARTNGQVVKTRHGVGLGP